MRDLLKKAVEVLLVTFAVASPGICQLQSAVKTFVYVNNDQGPYPSPNSVSAFAAQSGGSLSELTALGSPFLTGGTGHVGGSTTLTSHIAIAGRFLYASNQASNDISGFSIDPTTGALALVTTPPVPSGLTGETWGIALAATPDGRFLYAATNSVDTIVAFHIESNGGLTPILGHSLAIGADNLKVSPDGRFLAAAGSGLVTMFSISSGGALTQVDQAFVYAESLDFSCGSNLLYAPLFTSAGMVAVLDVASDGTLNQISGSPFSFNNNAVETLLPLLSPDDLHLFVTTRSASDEQIVASLDVTPGGGGSVTQTNPLVQLEASETTLGLGTDQSGTFLYVLSLTGTSDFLSVYRIDQTTGALSLVQPTVQLPTYSAIGSVAVFPPKTCFGNLAARQAQQDAGGLYGLGGKGFDYSGWGHAGFPSSSDGNQCEFQPPGAVTPSTAPCWIAPTGINSDYWYYDSNGGLNGVAARDYGMDCSGLVMWSYNTAVNATGIAQQPESDSKALPIWHERAAGQCSTSQSTLIANDVLDSTGHTKPSYQHPLDLRPGDLLCFNYSNDNPGVNHVAMYLGNQTSEPGQDTIEDYFRSSIHTHNGVVRGDVDTRPFLDVAGYTNCSSPAPTSICFNFMGFWRPVEPREAILWQAHSPVSLKVTDPDGYTLDANTWVVGEHEAYRAAGSLFYNDYSPGGDDMVFSPTLKAGTYVTQVVPKAGAAPTDTYSLTVTTAGGTVTLAENVPVSQIPPLGYGVESNGTTVGAFIPVGIDIKPGHRRKIINLKCDGMIPVAILSSKNFNAVSEVAHHSLTFGRTGNEQSLAFCSADAFILDLDRHDRHSALLCHFYTKKTSFQPGDTQGVLKGSTVGGQALRGVGSVQIVSNRR
jgi:6-phosphogluconolactonase (cycloisomerase 2 family)